VSLAATRELAHALGVDQLELLRANRHHAWTVEDGVLAFESIRPGDVFRLPDGGEAEIQRMGAPISVSTAVSLLPPDVQAAIQTVQSQVSDASPAVQMINTIAGGGAPSPAQVTAALAGVATLVTGDPLAGAAMAMAGGLVAGIQAALQGVFSALGLYSNTPVYNYIGLRRTTDVLPFGQLDPDWWFIRTGGCANSANCGCDANGDLRRIQNGQVPPGKDAHPGLSGNYDSWALEYFYMVLAFYDYAKKYGLPLGTGLTVHPDVWCGYGGNNFDRDLNGFERFVLPLLRQTLENWANGIGFVRPRDVLQQCAIVWNAQHGSETTLTYEALDMTAAYSPAAAGKTGMILARLLGGEGGLYFDNPNAGLARLPPLTINTGRSTTPRYINLHLGPAPATPTAAASSGLSTGTKVAIGAGVVGAAGVGLWAAVGQPMTIAAAKAALGRLVGRVF
jgi:hypothetical protein